MKARKARKAAVRRVECNKDGRVYALRHVVFGRVIPGWDHLDPLTLPFRARPTTVRRFADRRGVSYSEARVRLGVAWHPYWTDVADAWAGIVRRADDPAWRHTGGHRRRDEALDVAPAREAAPPRALFVATMDPEPATAAEYEADNEDPDVGARLRQLRVGESEVFGMSDVVWRVAVRS